MINIFSKTILFITSYFPLFLIFLVLDFNIDTKLFFNNLLLSYWLIAILLVSIIIWLLLIKWVFEDLIDINKQVGVENIENNNSEILAYLFTYVIPFIGIESDKKIIVTLILLVVTFTVYVKSDLIKYNIFLLFMGYDIVKVTTVDKEEVYLLKHKTTKIEKWWIIKYGEICNWFFIIK